MALQAAWMLLLAKVRVPAVLFLRDGEFACGFGCRPLCELEAGHGFDHPIVGFGEDAQDVEAECGGVLTTDETDLA